MPEKNKIEVVRADLIFSYWIFLWWILYMVDIIKFNPKFVIILAIIENLCILLVKVINGNYCSILSFIIINTFIKVIPLYTVRNDEITKGDVVFTIYLFLLYIVWLIANGKTNLITNVSWLTSKNKKSIAPFEYQFNKLFGIQC